MTSVESGYEDTFIHIGNQRLQVFVAHLHGEDRCRRNRRSDVHLVGPVGVDKVGFQFAFVEDGHRARGYPFIIEVTCSGGLDSVRFVLQGKFLAQYLLVELIDQERVLLLDRCAIDSIHDGRQQAGGVHIVDHHVVSARLGLLRAQLTQYTFQCFSSDTGFHQVVVIQGRIIPIRLRTGFALSLDTDATYQAEGRSRGLTLKSVAGNHVFEILLITIRS